MSNDKYISDSKLDEIRKEYGEKIISFITVKRKADEWYKEFGFPFPSSCINNYRDSWFHYRKIWVERSLQEVICQMATFDEHLQRAEKDAVVNFFQIVSQALQFWYHVRFQNIPEELLDNIQQNVDLIYEKCTPEERNDVQLLSDLWDKYAGDEQEASFALICVAQKYILNSKHMIKQIQQLLHLIKNTTLKIRLGASDIQRIDHPGEYLNQCCECYNALISCFNEKDNQTLFFLLGMTDIVRVNIDIYQIEHSRETHA